MNNKKPNLSVFTGFVCCFGMILTGIATNGGIGTVLNFIHIPSMIVTFGGSIFAVLITTESLGEFAAGINDAYMQKGIRLTIDGTDPELIKDIMETDLIHTAEEDRRQITFWENLGAYAPAWGMVGTLLGLINMMRNMGDNPMIIKEKIRTFRNEWEENGKILPE